MLGQMAKILNAFISILELKLNCVYIHAREERKWNLKFENFIEKLISKTDRNDDLLKFIESWKLFFPPFTQLNTKRHFIVSTKINIKIFHLLR